MVNAICGDSTVQLPYEHQIREFIGSVGDRLAATCLLTSVAMSSGRGQVSPSGGTIMRCGHLRKLKTLKKKYFVLRADAPGHPACLEYYDSKKKFDNRHPPKRSISMRSCFNINRRVDTKHSHVIALYTKDDCFSLILDSEKELDEWLNAMLLLAGDVPDGEQPRPTFEHVWQVTMQKKALGERKNIHGPYRLCLTDRTLSLVKVGAKDNSDSIQFSLICIRRCGSMDRIFYMEVGRSAVTGDGSFWMEAEDSNIAYNMKNAILNAMSSSSSNSSNNPTSAGQSSSSTSSVAGNAATATSRDDVGPRQRVRSSSANEASKPISVLQRRYTGGKLQGFSPLEEARSNKEQVDPLREQNVTASAPSQCSQSQSTSSSNTLTAVAGTGNIGTIVNAINNVNIVLLSSGSSGNVASNRRRHSVASHPHTANNSQTVNPTTMTMTPSTTTTTTAPPSTTVSTTTIQQSTIPTKSHQRTLSLPLAAVVVNQTQSSKRSVLRCATGRDRCDSLPSRARTTSEGHPIAVVLGHPRSGHLAPHVARPHSMYGRGLSYSPPVSSMPISPASGACSTDSAGSSLSMDDGADNILEEATASSRYGHSLTPDEPVILEENLDDYAPWSSNSHQPHKYSPNFKSHSPSQQSSYVEMYSPCGSSPGRTGGMSGGAYMPMSPATGAIQQHHNHSRASSLVEETTLPDGYVPMAPVGDAGYVDMDPSNASQHNGHFPDDMSQHGGSSCSVTSGTPSTDLRFSEYHLDKVTSYLAPGEEIPARPTRAYSVGSRPEPANRQRKNRLDIAQQEASRVRAFSVGSRSKRPEIVGRLASVITARLPSGDCANSNKSNSAPLLSSSWGHNSGCSVASERMEDLMELDFTRPNVGGQETVCSPPLSTTHSHSQSYSTATDTSSYVDMSPGQPHAASTNNTTAPYVDMSGINKINRNNNNNNTSTANNNHNHVHATTSVSSSAHKPVIKTLKPVEEADGAYMRMENSMEDWTRAGNSPKQAPSPMQDDYMQMNGPPGVTRTAPVDLPQPRRPPEGYVEMSFKSRPSLEQDYINMSMGASSGSVSSMPSSSSSRPRNRRTGPNNRNEKSQRSQPIAIQASSKSTKTPSFLPLNGDSPTSESLASTPASPPRATPTGSNATIFPFSLNSPQSPIKPFTASTPSRVDDTGKMYSAPSIVDDYALMEPAIGASSTCSPNPATTLSETTKSLTNSMKNPHEVPQSPLTKRLADLTIARPRVTRNSANSLINNALGHAGKDDADNSCSSNNSTNEAKALLNSPEAIGFRSLSNQQNDAIGQSPVSKRRGGEITFSKMKTSRGNFTKDENPSSSSSSSSAARVNNDNLVQNSQQELPTSPLTKRLCDLSVAKAKLVQPSPNTSPTPSAGFKIIQGQKSSSSSSGKMDESSGGTTPSVTPTATPSPLDSEGYEKLQPGATILHYASLDLPEVGGAPPVSPTPVIEGFSYAEIDFAKLKQN